MKEIITYVMDPLCGWSYGNSENFVSFYHELKEDYPFEILSGGIKINDEVTPGNPDMVDYIRRKSKLITSMTGAAFSDEFYENLASNPQYRFDSRPPSKAIAVIKKLSAANAIPYADSLQSAYFLAGEDINDVSVLVRIARQYEVEEERFQDLYHSAECLEATEKDFSRVRGMKVDSFPSLYLVQDSYHKLIGSGYMSLDEMRKAIAFCLKVFDS